MTVPEIKLAAYDYTRLPPIELPIAERLLWYELRDVYRRFREGGLSQADGNKLTAVYLAQHNTDSTHIEMNERIVRNQAAMWAEVETAADAYRLSDNHTNEADRLIEALYQVKSRKKTQNINEPDQSQKEMNE